MIPRAQKTRPSKPQFSYLPHRLRPHLRQKENKFPRNTQMQKPGLHPKPFHPKPKKSQYVGFPGKSHVRMRNNFTRKASEAGSSWQRRPKGGWHRGAKWVELKEQLEQLKESRRGRQKGQFTTCNPRVFACTRTLNPLKSPLNQSRGQGGALRGGASSLLKRGSRLAFRPESRDLLIPRNILASRPERPLNRNYSTRRTNFSLKNFFKQSNVSPPFCGDPTRTRLKQYSVSHLRDFRKFRKPGRALGPKPVRQSKFGKKSRDLVFPAQRGSREKGRVNSPLLWIKNLKSGTLRCSINDYVRNLKAQSFEKTSLLSGSIRSCTHHSNQRNNLLNVFSRGTSKNKCLEKNKRFFLGFKAHRKRTKKSSEVGKEREKFKRLLCKDVRHKLGAKPSKIIRKNTFCSPDNSQKVKPGFLKSRVVNARHFTENNDDGEKMENKFEIENSLYCRENLKKVKKESGRDSGPKKHAKCSNGHILSKQFQSLQADDIYLCHGKNILERHSRFKSKKNRQASEKMRINQSSFQSIYERKIDLNEDYGGCQKKRGVSNKEKSWDSSATYTKGKPKKARKGQKGEGGKKRRHRRTMSTNWPNPIGKKPARPDTEKGRIQNNTKSSKSKKKVGPSFAECPLDPTPKHALFPKSIEPHIPQILSHLFGISAETLVGGDYFIDTQPFISAKMRLILVDWLIGVHHQFGFQQETLFLAVSLLDRYLGRRAVEYDKFQLLGCVCFMVACKFEEIYPPKIREFREMCVDIYRRQEFVALEAEVLETLGFALTAPTCFHFLSLFRACFSIQGPVAFLSEYILNGSLLSHKYAGVDPKMMAYSSLLVAAKKLKLTEQVEPMKRSGLLRLEKIEANLCMFQMYGLLQELQVSSMKAVKEKFEAQKFEQIWPFLDN